MVRYLIVLFLILLTNFSFSQKTVVLTQNQFNAVKGIDRKAWNGMGNVSGHSDGYANDFTLPTRMNPCEKITNVKVNINITNYNKTSGCPHNNTFFNLLYGCAKYTAGATCPKSNVIFENSYPVNPPSATFNFTTLDFGGNLSVDIIPVSTPGCNPVTNGGLTYEYETTVTVTIAEDLPTTPAFTQVAPICSGGSLSSLPTTSNNGISGTWAPALDNTATTTYTFTPNSDECATSTTMTIVVNSVTLVITNPAPVCSGGTVDIKLPAVTTGSTTGTALSYWTDAAATTAISNPSAINTSDTYYIKSTLGGCSITKPVAVTITTATAPTAVAQTFCTSATVANLVATGTAIQWYAASTGGTALAGTTALVTGTTYYASQTIGTCESTRTAVGVTITTATAPTAVAQTFCASPAPTIANLTASGTAIKWYAASAGGTALATTTNVISGTYYASQTINGCESSRTSVLVKVNPSNTLTSVSYTVTDAFENNQIITVFATATGNYLYQLDSGPSQTSPIFENVSSGIHTITVSDVNGCSDSISVNDILVIKHPKFFTPNGDNYNDTWEISDLSNFISKIYIFDRYGKLLKEISPAGLGWDGTYLGVPMPADDYWFNIEYIENSVMKKFKSHFSLKR